MATVDITREHTLGKETARERAQKLADKLAQKLDAKCTWQGDELTFKRSGADGTIQVSDDNVRVQVKLGLMLTPMAGMIRGEVEKALEKYLA
ncbi:MAG: polyhydroxyalkanoic acid system family protein [Halopseudomonas yangmingensis]|uniref:Putative polyhydroxyalkanoic acid system protein n=1 Tax=Halopseudomonas yangmingensis TaxID=1720063 RepID=A0A1I4RWP8_9GAMM|nr:polyhydroxyalkanoic acid system family protein [Halopseudomonas yangmingensis]SFM56444.1 putative polyhydroxyalkanoic acid system protein [Halopseudomonas yangmingensis]